MWSDEYRATVIDRCVVHSTYGTHEYRRFFRRDFMKYLEASGFNVKEIERLPSTALDELWKMFCEDGRDN